MRKGGVALVSTSSFTVAASNASLSASSIVIAPVVAGEGYVVKLESGSLYLLEGECAVDGKPMLLHTSVSLSPGRS